MLFIARELREYMAKLGVRTVDELVGRTDLLRQKKEGRQCNRGVDLSRILAADATDKEISKAGQTVTAAVNERVIDTPYDFELEKTKDESILLKDEGVQKAISGNGKAKLCIDVCNTDRAFAALLGAEITRHNPEGLKDDSIVIECHGAGGQSFGAFIPKGLTLKLIGDSNDYLGKGLSGGRIAVYAPNEASYDAEENIIIGNVALYGATGGEAYIAGMAGERFCVRNSGATAVVEGVGEHGCEYMTGGRAVILGPTGKNFAAGMSGGIAYVLDEDNHLYRNLNKDMVLMEQIDSKSEKQELKEILTRHVHYTGSRKAKRILDDYDGYLPHFKKIIPADYKQLLHLISLYEEQGMSREEAQIEAFYRHTQ